LGESILISPQQDKPVTYEGPRTVEGFVSFLNQHATYAYLSLPLFKHHHLTAHCQCFFLPLQQPAGFAPRRRGS
jgi:hypothetical protein